MMKNLLLTLLVSLPVICTAQVSTQPENPTDSESITVYFDATGTGLENYSGNVYAYTGVRADGPRWSYLIGGWGDNSTNPLLSRDIVNPNLYSLEISPTVFDFYNVDSQAYIAELNLIFRAEDNSASTPNYFINIIPSNAPPNNINTWGVVGDATPNGWFGPDISMTYDANSNIWHCIAELNDGFIKFRYDNLWDLNYGDGDYGSTNYDGILDQNGADISVSAGTYTITANFDTFEYSIEVYEEPSWGIVGSATPNGWGGPDLTMEFDPNTNTWSTDVELINGFIKFRYDNNWDLNYGDDGTDGSLDQNGADIPVSSGVYKITTNFDTGEYSIGPPETVYVPDPNFEQALIDLGIDRDGVVNQSILKYDAEAVGYLNLDNPLTNPDFPNVNGKITDLTGVEAFTGMTAVNVNGNEIAHLDFSSNLNLNAIYANNCSTQTINVSNNINLVYLHVYDNQIETLDISNNLLLKELIVQSNRITTLDISQHKAIETLFATDNRLTSLNIANGNNANFVIPWGAVSFAAAANGDLHCIIVDADIVNTAFTQPWEYDAGVIFSSDCDTKPEHVYIPDSNFEQSLVDLGIDSDGVVNTWLLKSDAEAITYLNLNNPVFDSSAFANPLIVNVTEKIADLTGIEAFVNLTNLQLGYGALTTVDVSNNILLEELFLNDNQLQSIDVSNNAQLRIFGVMRNPLSISTVDVSNNVLLEELYVHETGITSIDVSKNLALWKLYVQSNGIKSLNMSKNTSLTDLRARYNSELTTVDLRNGNNSNLYIDFRDCPNLTCINADGVAEPDVSSEMVLYYAALLSTDCGDFVYIPDPNFELSLIKLGIDSDGVVNTSILREDAEAVFDLNLNNPNYDTQFGNPQLAEVADQIVDATGIEAFINLTKLQFAHSNINSIDVSSLTQLTELWLNDNALTTVDVSANTNLLKLGLMRNTIGGTVDVSNNTSLQELWLHFNQIDNLISSNTPDLYRLAVQSNNLTSLDLVNFPSLSFVSCQDNAIGSLDISSNQMITRVDAHRNSGLVLTTDPILGNITLTSLNLSGTGLSNYNGALYPNVEWLFLNDNDLTKFNGNNALNVQYLSLANNSIGSLNLSSNIALRSLNGSNNVLTELDLRNGNNANMIPVVSNNSEFPAINVVGNLLTCISVDDPEGLIQVYDTWAVDFGVNLSSNCKAEPEVVLIPDPNFESALGETDTDGIINGRIFKSDAEAVVDLDVSRNSIIDLTGIEAFVNLSSLNVSSNLLDTINLSANTSLQTLIVSNNLLESLDVRGIKGLSIFDSTNNLNLFCIGVDDQNAIPAGWTKDTWTSYSETMDCTSPNIIAQDVTIYLDNKGQASVDAKAFDNGSSDNVTLNTNLIFEISQTNFDCSNLGSNQITLTVYDEVGNGTFQTVTLYIEDNIPPSLTAVNDFSYDLNGMLGYSIIPEDLVKASSDNCGILNYSVDQSNFSALGTYIVTLTAEDSSGNIATDTVTITIEDSGSSAELKFKQNVTLTVFPVPFTTELNILFSKAVDFSTVQVALFDASGTNTGVTFSEVNGNLVSNSVPSSSGNYILQVTISGQTKSVVIVKN